MRLRLYVPGRGLRSSLLEERTRRLLTELFPEGFTLEVVDAIANPGEAERARVVALPTLIVEQPLPERRIVGELSDSAALGLALAMRPRQLARVPATRTESHLIGMVADQAPVALIATDSAGVLHFVNRAAAELLGKPRESLVGRYLGLPLLTERPIETEVIRGDGQRVTIEMHVSAATFENVPGYVASLHDITHARREQDALEREHARLLTLVQEIPEAVAFTDASGRIVEINRPGEVLLGIAGTEVKGAALPGLCGVGRIDVLHLLREAERNGSASRVIRIGNQIETKHVGFSVSTLQNVDGRLQAFDVVMRDVTADTLYDRVGKALQSDVDPSLVLHRFADALRVDAPVSVVAVGHRDGDLIRWLAAYPANVVPHPIEDAANSWGPVNPRTPVLVETTARSKAAIHSRVAASGAGSYAIYPIREADEIVGYLLIGFDRTERRHDRALKRFVPIAPAAALVIKNFLAMEDRESAIDALRSADRLKSDFVSMVAHDLRNPLAVISGFAQTLDQHWATLHQDDVKLLLRRLHGKVGEMTRFVNTVLDVGQIEAGTLPFDKHPFDLGRTVRACVADARIATPEASFEVSLPRGRADAFGDPARIGQVVTNLLANAVKFSGPGPHISVRVEPRDDGYAVSITDSGSGVPEEERDMIFERFSKGGSRRTGGAGLGLFICKTIVEAHGGTIALGETAEGEGATFVFTIPAASTPKQ